MAESLRAEETDGAGEQESVKVGVIGLGGMGTTHASNIAETSATIAAGADVVPDIRDSFEERFDADVFAEFETMLEEVALDGVVVATPNAFHAPAAVAALERDIPVLVEKPLADTLENAERIAEAAAESEAFGMVGFHNRFCASADLFREFHARGDFGDIEHIEANYLRRRGIPGLGSWFTSKELSGGGALIDIGVHVLDFALYLAGSPAVTDVSGVTRTSFGNRKEYADPDNWGSNWDQADQNFDVEDSATAFIRCENGTTITLDVSWATNREPNAGVVVRGTDAGASLSLGGDTLSINTTGTDGHDHYAESEYSAKRDPSGHRAEDELFVECLATGETPGTNTIEEGLNIQRVLDAIYRSSEAGHSVSCESESVEGEREARPVQ